MKRLDIGSPVHIAYNQGGVNLRRCVILSVICASDRLNSKFLHTMFL